LDVHFFIRRLGAKDIVIVLSAATLWILAIFTPSSSIHPLLKLPIFWKLKVLRTISSSVAVNFMEPT
jgi:hypothetical protein